MAYPSSIRMERWNPDASCIERDIEMLGALLHASVHAGASISFVLPFSLGRAQAFWREQVLPGVNAGTRVVLLARHPRRIAGTIQLDLATPPNQPHRAEVKKLLVHPEARRQGIGGSLMAAVEREARAAYRTLLTLDTVTGGPAERLYRSLGYVAIGSIPGFALNYDSSVLEATTVMYKKLAS
ncbi:MAG: GNAT family N-acetyltransferase [Bryobacteraceae bacterium]